MIKIRYRDPNELSPGLHAEAERRGRCTTVYLLSGLTKQERRAALRRLRLSARMGYCPSLPAPQLALALLKDRIRTGAWQTGAVVRLHPAGSTVPVMVLSGGAIAFLLLSTVSIHVLRPRTADETPAGAPPIAGASAIPFPGVSRDLAGAGLGSPGQSGSGSVPVSAVSSLSSGLPPLSSPGLIGPGAGGTIGPWSSTGTGGTGQSGTGQSGTSQSGTSQSGTGQSGTGQSGGTNGSSNNGSSNNGSSNNGSSNNGGTSQSSSGSTSGGTSSDSGGSGSGSGTSSSSSGGSGTSTSGSTSAGSTTPTPTQTATPAPSSEGSGGGACLDVGPLGLCLSV